jgi:hypothetical protein
MNDYREVIARKMQDPRSITVTKNVRALFPRFAATVGRDSCHRSSETSELPGARPAND